jgi:hypothetical protein
MASTRNKNTAGDYRMEQQINRHLTQYNVYKNSAQGTPWETHIPDVGWMPSNVSRETFATNAVDVESMLRGTGESNLVEPKGETVVQKVEVGYKSFFERPVVATPEPLVLERFQRPNLRR